MRLDWKIFLLGMIMVVLSGAVVVGIDKLNKQVNTDYEESLDTETSLEESTTFKENSTNPIYETSSIDREVRTSEEYTDTTTITKENTSASKEKDTEEVSTMRPVWEETMNGSITYVLKDTKNLYVYTPGLSTGKLIGDNVTAYVDEENEDVTQDEVRRKFLSSIGMVYYANCEPSDLPLDNSIAIEGVGITDWENFYKDRPYKDASIEDWCQILVDTSIKSTFGDCLYIETYNPNSMIYTSYCVLPRLYGTYFIIKVECMEKSLMYDMTMEVLEESLILSN